MHTKDAGGTDALQLRRGGGNPITTLYDGFGVRMKVPNLCLGVGPPSFVALKISNK